MQVKLSVRKRSKLILNMENGFNERSKTDKQDFNITATNIYWNLWEMSILENEWLKTTNV